MWNRLYSVTYTTSKSCQQAAEISEIYSKHGWTNMDTAAPFCLCNGKANWTLVMMHDCFLSDLFSHVTVKLCRGKANKKKLKPHAHKRVNQETNSWTSKYKRGCGWGNLQRLMASDSCWFVSSAFAGGICSLVSSTLLLMFSSRRLSLCPRFS